MRLPRVTDVLYVAAILSLVIAMGIVNSYSSSLHYGLVQVRFQIQVFAYKLDGGDYAQIYNDSLVASFTGTVPPTGNNQTTVIAYSTGQLDHPLSMSCNITLMSLSNGLVLPTECRFTFTRPGSYAVTCTHVLRDIPAGRYLVNMTYTDSVHELPPKQIWASIAYYYDVE
jgi:hypothetical protein